MKRLADNLFHFEAKETRGERIVFHVFELFVIACTVKYYWEWAPVINGLSMVVLPLGVAPYLDVSFLFGNGMSLVSAALGTVLCLMGLLRIGSQYAYLGALLILHLQYVARYSQGEISHGSNLVGMSLLGLALAMLVFKDAKLRRRFTLGFIYFFAGLGYTSAAVSKLVGTGLHWSDGQHLMLWMHEQSVDVLSKYGEFTWNPLQAFILDNPGLGGVMLTFGLVAELCGILFWFRKTRYYAIAAIISMHIGIALTMNLFFAEFTYELIIIGVPWAVLIDKFLARHTFSLAGA